MAKKKAAKRATKTTNKAKATTKRAAAGATKAAKRVAKTKGKGGTKYRRASSLAGATPERIENLIEAAETLLAVEKRIEKRLETAGTFGANRRAMPAGAVTTTTTTTPVRRGPGRPKKVMVAAKRGPGRPRKNVEVATPISGNGGWREEQAANYTNTH